jgi:parallel beta-helix repeat protein
VLIEAEPGATPRLGNLAFKAAAGWTVAELDISPEGVPEGRRNVAVLVNIPEDCRDITIRGCRLFTVKDGSAWTEADWKERSMSGINSAGSHCIISDNVLRYVRFGISVGHGGEGSTVARNRIEDFMSDGMRGLADNCVFEYNVVKNCYAIDGNHDDGFQSWSGGAKGQKVGTGVVKGIVLRGNTFISYTDPAQPFKAAMQGIGCFDGMFEGWVVENNLIVTDMWHGIALYGAVNCRIVNNTVLKNPIDAAARTPWILISPHKRKMPSSGNVVRNNIAATITAPESVGVADHNLTSKELAAEFVDFAHFDFHLKPGSAAVGTGSAELAPALDLERRERKAPHDLGAYASGKR